jgi:predicted RNase H-like nuclease (RuvC/YqgF family)
MIREEEFHEERITLGDGSILIRTEEGIYFQTMSDCSIPLLIDRYEGEILLFKEARRLKERNQQLHRNYNTRAEKYHYLEKENQRMKKQNALLRNTSPLMCTMQLEQENQCLRETLEHIKEKCKDAGAYTLAAEVYHIAHVELKGEGE